MPVLENCKIFHQYRGSTATDVPVARSQGITVNLGTIPAVLQRSLSPLLRSRPNSDLRGLP